MLVELILSSGRSGDVCCVYPSAKVGSKSLHPTRLVGSINWGTLEGPTQGFSGCTLNPETRDPKP